MKEYGFNTRLLRFWTTHLEAGPWASQGELIGLKKEKPDWDSPTKFIVPSQEGRLLLQILLRFN
jgi:hypothetical protein